VRWKELVTKNVPNFIDLATLEETKSMLPFYPVLNLENIIRLPTGYFQMDGKVYGYLADVLIAMKYVVTSSFSDFQFKGSSKYQGVSETLVFELLDHDGNVVTQCSENTPTFDTIKSVCDHDGSKKYANSLPCRFETKTPLIPIAALFAAAGIEMNEPNQRWLDACIKDFSSITLGSWHEGGQEGLEKANQWLAFNKTYFPSMAALKHSFRENNFEYLCRYAKYPRFGTTFLVALNYNNEKKGGTEDISVQATVTARPSYYHTHDLAPGQQTFNYGRTQFGTPWYTQTNRRGISIVVQHDGNICSFSFQALLLTLTSALGLIAIAGVVTDLIMVHIDPNLLKVKYAHVNWDGHHVRDNAKPSESQKHLRLQKGKHRRKHGGPDSTSLKDTDIHVVALSNNCTPSIKMPATCKGDRNLGSHRLRRSRAAHQSHHGRSKRVSRRRAFSSSGPQGGELEMEKLSHNKSPGQAKMLRSKSSAKKATGHSRRHRSLSPRRTTSMAGLVARSLSPCRRNSQVTGAVVKHVGPANK